MIKIIKNTMEEPIEKTCEFCKSVISYNYQDIQTETRRDALGFRYRDRFLTCPVCKEKIIFATTVIGDKK